VQNVECNVSKIERREQGVGLKNLGGELGMVLGRKDALCCVWGGQGASV
jgi:hypothetical protein